MNYNEYKPGKDCAKRGMSITPKRRLKILNARPESTDNIEQQFRSIRYKVLGYIEKLNDLPYDIKEELVRKVFKKIYIKDDYTLEVEYTFEE